jgi:hypothetical protein
VARERYLQEAPGGVPWEELSDDTQAIYQLEVIASWLEKALGPEEGKLLLA